MKFFNWFRKKTSEVTAYPDCTTLRLFGRVEQSMVFETMQKLNTVNSKPLRTTTIPILERTLKFDAFGARYNWWQRFKLWLQIAFPNIKIGSFHATYSFSYRSEGWDVKVVSDDGVEEVKVYMSSSFSDLPGLSKLIKNA